MGFWKRLRRPRCGGMYIEDGTLYTQRSWRDPEFQMQVTRAEQEQFRRPAPYSLHGARAKIENFRDAPAAMIGVGVGPVIPFVPIPGKKVFKVTVRLADQHELIGLTHDGHQALRFWKAINKSAKRQTAQTI